MQQQPGHRRGATAYPSLTVQPGGDLEAESRLYPTRRATVGAVGFLRYVDQVQPRQVRIGRSVAGVTVENGQNVTVSGGSWGLRKYLDGM